MCSTRKDFYGRVLPYYAYIIGTVLIFLCSTLASADIANTKSLQDKALHLANMIEKNEWVSEPVSQDIFSLLETRPPQEQIQILRKLSARIFTDKLDISANDVLRNYNNSALEHNFTEDIAVSTFYLDVYSVYSPNKPLVGYNQTLSLLDKYLKHSNWFIQHQAYSIQSALHADHRNSSLALNSATTGFEIIPAINDEFVSLAKAQSLERISYLHNLLLNPNLSVNSLEDYINVQIAADNTAAIDGITLINNLIYAFNGWQDHQTAEKLSLILLRLEKKYGANTPGLAQTRAATTSIKLGKYAQALSFAQDGIQSAQIDVLLDKLRIAEIEAYAGLGNIVEAKKRLNTLKLSFIETDSSSDFELKTRYAQSLIAASEGDSLTAIKLMKQVAEKDLQNLLSNNNNNTASLLANLENNKERQQEREAAAKREAELVQKQLEEQVKSTRLFLTVAILFGVMAAMAAIFALYRSRTSKRLAKSAEAALAGEKAKTQFLAVMSHELRTPLNGILGIADMLTQTAPTPELRSQIGIINNSGNDLLRLVEQILDMSRLDANELEIHPDTVDVREIIHKVDRKWRAGIEQKGITFTAHVEPSVPDNIIIDPRRLEQCVSNLVSNAGRFTESGRVHLHVTARKVSDITLHDKSAKRERLSDSDAVDIRIIVADTGMGMTPEVQSRLFQPFVQADSTSKREFGGSGLGLAITSSLADMMDGSISVNSRKGGGSEFTLRFRCRLDQTQVETTQERKLSKAEQAPTKDAMALKELGNIFSALPEIERRSEAKRHERRKANHSNVAKNLREIADIKETLKQLGINILIVDDARTRADILAAYPLLDDLKLSCINDPIFAETILDETFDIICVSVGEGDTAGLSYIESLRNSPLEISELPIIALTSGSSADINAACIKAGANLFLSDPVAPEKFAEAIEFLSGNIQGQLDIDLPRRSA